MTWWAYVLLITGSYFLGNITFGRIVASFKHSDVTKLGSGNPGSTNILRNFGFKLGLITFLLDISKGVIATLTGLLISGGDPIVMYAAGLASIVGHIFPVIYKFKGGKGIATMIGVFFVTTPIVTLIVCVVGALFWLSFEYGSVSSFWCVTALTVIEGIKAKNLPGEEAKTVCLLLFAIFVLTWFAHRSNIQRLLVGKESKVSLIRSIKKKINK